MNLVIGNGSGLHVSTDSSNVNGKYSHFVDESTWRTDTRVIGNKMEGGDKH